MKYIIPPLQALLLIVLTLLAPIIVLFALPFIKWDDEPSVGPQRTITPPYPTIMGDFPSWLSWFRTPDQRLPGDTGIKEVSDVLQKYGKWVCAWYWAGTRNQFMGLACWLGKPTSDYIPEDVEGLWTRGDVWKYRKTLWRVKFYTGYTAYALLDGTFQAAPILTIKL